VPHLVLLPLEIMPIMTAMNDAMARLFSQRGLLQWLVQRGS
jgi:hypothetical protein